MGDTNIESNLATEEEVSPVSLTADDVVARLTSSSVSVRVESLEKLSDPGKSKIILYINRKKEYNVNFFRIRQS